MSEDTIYQDVRQATLGMVGGDFMGLWSVPWYIERAYPDCGREKVKSLTLRVVGDLLRDRLVRAGQLDRTGARFIPAEMTAEQVVDFIDREWAKLGRTPNVGEVIWFDTVD